MCYIEFCVIGGPCIRIINEIGSGTIRKITMAIEVKKHHFSQIEKCVLHCTVSSVISNSKALGFQKRYITYSQLNGKTLDITVRKEEVQKSIFAFSAILVNIVLLILTMNGNVNQKVFSTSDFSANASISVVCNTKNADRQLKHPRSIF